MQTQAKTKPTPANKVATNKPAPTSTAATLAAIAAAPVTHSANTPVRTNHIMPVVNGLAANAPAGTIALAIPNGGAFNSARAAHLQGAGAATPSGMAANYTLARIGKVGGCGANQALTASMLAAFGGKVGATITGAALLAAMGGTAVAKAHVAYRAKGAKPWLVATK